MSQAERAPIAGKVKKIRLEKYENDPATGQPIRDNGPIEVWEGDDESNMKCILRRGEDDVS